MEDILQALGAPRRREILRLVRRGEMRAGEIHRALGGVTFGAVSQHLGVLERARLLTARRDGRHRLYTARPEGLEPLKEWLDSMWGGALVSLKRLAEEEEHRTSASRPRERGSARRTGREEGRRPAGGRATRADRARDRRHE